MTVRGGVVPRDDGRGVGKTVQGLEERKNQVIGLSEDGHTEQLHKEREAPTTKEGKNPSKACDGGQ